MLRTLIFVAGLSWLPAFADTPPVVESTPSADASAAVQAAAPPTAAASATTAVAGDEQQAFEQYRRDLVNLLALRAEADLLVAAAELAYPDSEDKARASALKSPSLVRRAQKFGPDSALVWWVSTFLECAPDAATCAKAAVAKLPQVDADNAAA